ncbi:TonB-dependent receptor [Lichenicoccus sp.]|uniref:TonB-dependent receptor n=1 Tax=Lichenicoccus sp. TaxID=2781899 RepID=UPI003D149B65
MDTASTRLGGALLLLPALGGVALAQAGPSNGTGTGTQYVTVRGEKAIATGSLGQALQLKRDAPNLIEVQPQSEIRKLPDTNVAEALQRVSGVSLETDTGEGRFINIRGLDADLNGVSFDGVRLMPSNVASPFGGGRAIALDAIPAGFVGGLEVIKSLEPDQDAEALGGAVNIIPREPRTDGLPTLDLNAGSGYEPLRQTAVIQGGITFSGSFGLGANGSPLAAQTTDPQAGFISNDKPFGIVGTATFYNDQRGVNDAEEAYADNQSGGTPDKVLSQLNPRYYQYWRRRFSHGGSFQFDPNPDNHFYFRLAEAGYNERISRHMLVLNGLDSGSGLGGDGFSNPDGPGFIATGVTADQDLRDETEAIQNNVIEWGGRNKLADGIEIDYRGSWSEGSYYKPYDYNSDFQDPQAIALAYDNVSTPFQPTYHTLDGTNLADPANYNFFNINNSSEHDIDREWAGEANISIPAPLLGDPGTIRFGGSARLRDKTVTRSFQNYSLAAGAPVFSLANYTYGRPQIFYNGRLNVGPMINGGIRSLIGTPFLTEDVAADSILGQQAFQADTENVYAGYGQYDWTLGKLSLLAGIRLEATDARYGANSSATDAARNTTITPIVAPRNYVDYFPTVQARYALTRNLIARLAYSTAIGRPGFNQITSAQQIDFGNGVVTRGNPGLAPTTADDFDFTLAQYLPHAGVISIGAFDKEFHNYILPNQVQGTFPGIPGIAAIQTFTSSPSSRATGAELQYIQRFAFLPSPLDGLGVDSNYTYVSSETQIRPGETGSLPSTSNNTFNVALTYEKGPVQFRFGTAYVGHNLYAISSSRATDLFAAPRFRIDMGTSYALNRYATLYFDAKNLTNTPLQFTEGPTNSRPIQREYYDATYLAGIRASF